VLIRGLVFLIPRHHAEEAHGPALPGDGRLRFVLEDLASSAGISSGDRSRCRSLGRRAFIYHFARTKAASSFGSTEPARAGPVIS
jgi:hypothetical protein